MQYVRLGPSAADFDYHFASSVESAVTKSVVAYAHFELLVPRTHPGRTCGVVVEAFGCAGADAKTIKVACQDRGKRIPGRQAYGDFLETVPTFL